ncbi:GtrA family protein [Patescibacteria group bacterium]|nr:GtrA family protein [Patescibacteria group bacterium]MBU2219677.1 GtrA family protein [Patescibacteria group bacterium]
MDEQTSQQNQTVPAPVPAGLSVFQKDLIISAVIGLFCAAFILPIAQNLEMKQGLALSLFLILPVLSAVGMGAAYWLAKKVKIFYQLAKFVLVGALNSLVDWGILNLLMFLTSLTAGTMFSVFKGISFLVAMANSYFWNKFWTFKKAEELSSATSSAQKSGKEMLQFFIVSLVGFTLNVGAATLLVNVLGPQFGLSAKLWANAGALAGTALGMSWNFVGYKLIVFKS